jgi:hypothetical protein
MEIFVYFNNPLYDVSAYVTEKYVTKRYVNATIKVLSKKVVIYVPDQDKTFIYPDGSYCFIEIQDEAHGTLEVVEE